jgi:hypothetical protein
MFPEKKAVHIYAYTILNTVYHLAVVKIIYINYVNIELDCY